MLTLRAFSSLSQNLQRISSTSSCCLLFAASRAPSYLNTARRCMVSVHPNVHHRNKKILPEAYSWNNKGNCYHFSQQTNTDIAQRLQHDIYKIHGKVSPLEDKKNTNGIISLLLDVAVPEEELLQFLGKHPKFLRFPLSGWQQGIEQLVLNGFSRKELLPVLEHFPQVLEGTFDSLLDAMGTLRGTGMKNRQTRNMIIQNPKIVDLHPKKIISRFNALMKHFTKQDVFNVLKNSPNVLTDPFETFEAKYIYIYEEMVIDESQMAATKAFSHSLLHIQTRHKFLERTGLYKKPKKVMEPSETNPKLISIVETSDEDFASDVVGLSVEEYQVFKQLLVEEMEYEGYRMGDMMVDDGPLTDDEDEDTN